LISVGEVSFFSLRQLLYLVRYSTQPCRLS
jgi:hypothetical protein